MKEYDKLIGNFFKQKRQESNLSMTQISKLCGHSSKGWYGNIEYGISSLNASDCIKLCKVLNTSLNDLQAYIESHGDVNE